MPRIDKLLPYMLLGGTLALELIAVLTSHMIDSRILGALHEGIFQRCSYPRVDQPSQFNCYWWSSDTFNVDKGALQAVVIMTFVTLFLLGFTLLFAAVSHFYTELRTRFYNLSMAIACMCNALVLIAIIFVYTFGYATDTAVIPGPSTHLVFSWSYYLLFGALGANFIAIILFMYNPIRRPTPQSYRAKS